MKSSAKSINLTSLDDLFSTEESRAEESCEKVVRIPLTELHPFPNHPFHVRDDEAMQNTVDSIKEYGVLTPGIVRPREDGGYEIVAGHRRKHGSELAGLTDMGQHCAAGRNRGIADGGRRAAHPGCVAVGGRGRD